MRSRYVTSVATPDHIYMLDPEPALLLAG